MSLVTRENNGRSIVIALPSPKMLRGLKVTALDPGRIDQAYPLARLAVHDLTLDGWRRFAAGATIAAPANVPRLGILAATNNRGYIQGLAIYRVEPDLRYGASLTIEHFVALDLIDSGVVANQLVEALESEARRQGCQIIQTHLPQNLMLANAGARQLFRILQRSGLETPARHVLASVGGH
jgi:hypothetical protein